MIDLLIYIVVVCVVIGVAWWILDYVPVPEPLNRIAKIVIIVIGLIIIVSVLLRLTGASVDLPALD